MFFVSLNGAGSKRKLKLLLIVLAFAVTAILAVVLSKSYSAKNTVDSGYCLDLTESGGVEGFLSQFGLESEEYISQREITLPSEDDPVFIEYAGFLAESGFDILDYSGKKAKEMCLSLKDTDENGEKLFGIIIVHKDKVIGAHIDSFLKDSKKLSIDALN